MSLVEPLMKQRSSIARKLSAMFVPRISKTPLWVLFLSVSLAAQTLPLLMYLFLPNAPSWALGISLLLSPLTCALTASVTTSRRLNVLSAMLSQDPRVVVGDPLCLELLRAVPWYGVREVDRVQCAILQTYGAFAADATRAGQSLGVSHAGAVAADGDDDGSATWNSGESLDEDAKDRFAFAAAPGRSETGSFHSLTSTPRSRTSVDSRFHSIPSSSLDARASLTQTPPGKALVGVCIGAPAAVTCDPLNDNAVDWDTALRGVRDPGHSIILQLLRQVSPGQPLSAVTLPFHILEPRSLLEKLSDLFVHSEFLLLVGSPKARHPYEFAQPSDAQFGTFGRLLAVAQWFLSSFHLRPQGAKKPYNPILGEVFRCRFNEGKPQQVEYVAEQVCHHPPVTAFLAVGCGVRIRSTYHPKSKLVSPNCAASLGRGVIQVQVESTGEIFELGWPSAYVSGFLTGGMRLELGDKVVIRDAGSGARAELEFLRKGWVSGSYDCVVGKFFDASGKFAPLRVEGAWHGEIHVALDPQAPKQLLFHHLRCSAACRPRALDVPGHTKQARFVWRYLTLSLRDGKEEAAAAAKHEVETIQREERKKMSLEKRAHQTQLFKWLGEGELHASKDIDKVQLWEPCFSF